MSTYHAESGESIWCAINRVKRYLTEQGYDARGVLIFNEIPLSICASSHEDDIVDKYYLLRRLHK